MERKRFARELRNFTAAPRRHVVGGMLATIVGVVAGRTSAHDASAANRRRRNRRLRQRRRSQLKTVCFSNLAFRVNETQAAALVEAGGLPGPCSPPGGDPGGDPSCQNGTLPCSTHPTSCGGDDSGCTCALNTIGQSVCILPPPVCLGQRSTCTVDSDCEQYGGGSCVPTWGCVGMNCGGNGNACAPPCPQN